MTDPTKPALRRYGQWAGNPKGYPEDPSRCIEEVFVPREFSGHQCLKKRGFGKDNCYCKQHSKRRDSDEEEVIYTGESEDDAQAAIPQLMKRGGVQ